MSDVIHVLPDSVANQIAAGEVIQRPASVVKELVENAIDAQAQHIHVVIVDSGKTSIQVIDDGKGMSPTDARLSLERHATSKIRTAADLFALHTMGFRGEALASIVAVAQVTLKTRRKEDELATLIDVEGSEVVKQEETMAPAGTSIMVKNLFYNVPARRKFLKSNTVELKHIITEFERIVLVHPDISFTLVHNDSELYSLPATNLLQRILNIYKTVSNSLKQQLIHVVSETSVGKIEGYIGTPQAARKKNAVQFFFVNGRYMRHPYFHKAVMGCYEHLIPQEEAPNYFLYFSVDPSTIDVNVHPTKTEIKFSNESVIWQILTAAVKETLGKANAIPTIDFDQADAPDIPVLNYENSIHPPEVYFDQSYNPFERSFHTTSGNTGMKASPRRNISGWEQLYNPATNNDSFSADVESNSFEFTPDNYFFPEKEPSNNELFQEERYNTEVISVKGKYLLTAVKSGVMLIDQHRAHVRILYEQYLSQITHKQGVSQQLLFPERLELTLSESVTLEAIWDELHYIGFNLSRLGKESFSINAVPTGIEGLQPTKIIENLIHDASEKSEKVTTKIEETVALSMAKTAAIPYGLILNNQEIEKLISDLFRIQANNYTPDGKPIYKIISNDDLDKHLK